MDIFKKAAFQSLKNSRARTLVTIVGVILSTAMVTAVTTFAASLQTYLVNGAVARYGGWHVNFLETEEGFAQEQAADDRVESVVSYTNVGYARLEGSQNPDKPYLFLAGFDKEDLESLPVTLVMGRLPEKAGEVLVPSHVASNGGVRLSVGDMLSLSPGERMDGGEILSQHDAYRSGEELLPENKKNYKVVGICERPAFEERTAPGYTLITVWEGAAADRFGAFVTLKDPYQARRYAEEVAEGRDYAFNRDVMRFMGLAEGEALNGYLYAIGIILILLIMLGSIFLIYNSFTISLNDRVRQFGILLSVGATEKQLRSMVLFEGFCIGLAGIPLGVLTGLPVIKLVLVLVTENFENVLYAGVPLQLTISLPALAASALISMVTILLSAYLPARKAARTPVMECIRQTNNQKMVSKSLRTSKVAARIWGLPGILALKNFRRNRQRYRSIILSLVLSVVLCVAAGSFGSDLKRLAGMSVVDIEGDIFFQGKDMTESQLQEVYDSLLAVEGVYEGARDQENGCLVFWSKTPAQSTGRMNLVLEAMGVTGAYTLRNVHAALEENRNMLFVVNLFAAVFIVMISLIAVANVFNTISTNVRLRRRELAMLRSVGMSHRDFNRMMRLECVLYGLRTLVYGLPAALLCAWGIYEGLIGMEKVEGIGFVFPWKSMAVSTLGVFLVIFVTELYAVGKVRRENIIEALRDDMT